MSIAVYSAQQTQQLFDLFSAMTDYYAGDPARINHFVKVHAYARQIGLAEQLDFQAAVLLVGVHRPGRTTLASAKQSACTGSAAASCKSASARPKPRRCWIRSASRRM